MESNDELKEQVLTAFRERNVAVKREDIDAAIQDDGTCAWLRDHIGSDTLLSKEELTLYAKLEASGSLRSLLQGQDISTIRPFLDDEMGTAIESLNASTTAIDKQTHTLKSQCKELSSQLHSAKKVGQAEEKALDQLQRRHTLGKQQTDVAIEDITHDLETNLAAAQGLLSAENAAFTSQITSVLKDDDRLIKSLEKVVSNLQIAENDKDLSTRASKLSEKLAKYTAEEVHLRLDRLYLEEEMKGHPGGLNESAEEETEQITNLEEEINSLYSEINVLSEMTADQKFRTPMAQALQARHGEFHTVSEKQLDYIHDTLNQLTQSSTEIAAKLMNRRSHRVLVDSLAAAFKSHLDEKRTEVSKKQKASRRSTMRLSISSTPHAKTEQQQPLVQDEDVQALDNLLRRLGVSLSALLTSDSPSTVDEVLNDKKGRMLEMLETYRSTAELPLGAALGPADNALQLLLSSLHADSEYSVSLTERAHEKRLKALQDQIGALRKGIDGPVFDTLQQADKAQERFVERWS